jgi:hypothetical protein
VRCPTARAGQALALLHMHTRNWQCAAKARLGLCHKTNPNALSALAIQTRDRRACAQSWHCKLQVAWYAAQAGPLQAL